MSMPDSMLTAPGDAEALLKIVTGKVFRLPVWRRVRQAYGLTDRQGSVAILLCQGYSSLQISERLGLSVHTVNGHRSRLALKLGVAVEQAPLKILMTAVGYMEVGMPDVGGGDD
jgi:DNA-binding CsgD family transcriptional regulator